MNQTTNKQDKELTAYTNWRNKPTPETAKELVDSVQNYITHAIAAAGGDASNPVLRAKANMMALQCLPRFKPEKSTLQNFLYANLRGLHRVIGSDNNIIQIEKNLQKNFSELKKFTYKYSSNYIRNLLLPNIHSNYYQNADKRFNNIEGKYS